MRGVIKRLVSDKGYGFVKPENGGGDIFFHLSSVLDYQWEDLQEGMRVEFETEQGKNGICNCIWAI